LHLMMAPSQAVIAAASVHGYQKGYLVASCFGIGASLFAAVVIRNRVSPNATVDPAAMAG
jgi:hypothetical protein